jgi:hypothetical protein
MRHLRISLLIVLFGLLPGVHLVDAQQATPPQTPPSTAVPNAHDTRQSLNELLEKHPPSLREVLRIDPMLLRNTDYLALYPALAAFLQQHPEIGHNPEFFLGASTLLERAGETPQMVAARAIRDVAQSGAALLIIIAITTGILLLARTAAEHRRWLRASKAQAELNHKVIDRFASSSELLGYLESSHGKALTASLLPGTVAQRSIEAPLGRIFGSMQAGSVLAFAGAGLLFISSRLGDLEPVASGVFAIGTVVLMVGIGFLASSAISFVLSRRLGLVPPLSNPPTEAPGA